MNGQLFTALWTSYLNELHTFPLKQHNPTVMTTIFELNMFWVNQSIITVVCGLSDPAGSASVRGSLCAAVTVCVGDTSADIKCFYQSLNYRVQLSVLLCWLLFLTHCPGSVLVLHQGWRASISSQLLSLSLLRTLAAGNQPWQLTTTTEVYQISVNLQNENTVFYHVDTLYVK